MVVGETDERYRKDTPMIETQRLGRKEPALGARRETVGRRLAAAGVV